MKERAIDLISLYVAFARALYSINQSHHWRCKGTNFYGNHLLFQRLYKDNQEWADMAAERTLGLFGELRSQFEAIDEIARTFSNPEEEGGELIESSLQACKAFGALSNELYREFKEMNVMTLGLDDMIMSIASQLETHIYLLESAKKDTSVRIM